MMTNFHGCSINMNVVFLLVSDVPGNAFIDGLKSILQDKVPVISWH